MATLLIFIHIEHICSFFVAFFSATIDGRNLIFGHKLHIGTPYRGKRFVTRQIPTSCLPKSGGIIVYQTCKQQHALYRTHFQAPGGLLFYENGIGKSQMFNLGAKDETSSFI
jgi:hypothetical protein